MYCDKCKEYRTVFKGWPTTYKYFKCGKVLFLDDVKLDTKNKVKKEE